MKEDMCLLENKVIVTVWELKVITTLPGGGVVSLPNLAEIGGCMLHNDYPLFHIPSRSPGAWRAKEGLGF